MREPERQPCPRNEIQVGDLGPITFDDKPAPLSPNYGAKILVVESCDDCCHYQHPDCTKMYKEVDEGDDIPEWCPLINASDVTRNK